MHVSAPVAFFPTGLVSHQLGLLTIGVVYLPRLPSLTLLFRLHLFTVFLLMISIPLSLRDLLLSCFVISHRSTTILHFGIKWKIIGEETG